MIHGYDDSTKEKIPFVLLEKTVNTEGIQGGVVRAYVYTTASYYGQIIFPV